MAGDDYARSVADAAAATAAARGLSVVIRRRYNLTLPDWPRVMADLAAARPDVIILASHIPDGIAFRQAMLAAGLQVGALIGSTMAECDPDFAGELGADAVGIFASDRPTAGFRPSALGPVAARRVCAIRRCLGGGVEGRHRSVATNRATATATPSTRSTVPRRTPTAEQSEEALAGYAAAWALFRYVLPAASADASVLSTRRRLPPRHAPSTCRRARCRTAPACASRRDPARLGQNERAAAVIWQWQAVRTYAFVWPPIVRHR